MTDIHLDHASEERRTQLFQEAKETGADAVILTGDVTNGTKLEGDLRRMAKDIGLPIYFVLGNHDFYGISVGVGQEIAAKVSTEIKGLTYLSRELDPILLSEETALVGHDGWCDGRIGTLGTLLLNDEIAILDLAALPQSLRIVRCQELAEDAVNHMERQLRLALDQRRRVIVATHVPPFQEASWFFDKDTGQTRISDREFLPYFTCKKMGDLFLKEMRGRPDQEMLVLCGHSHGEGSAEILPNLKVLTGGAEYKKPRVQEGLIEA